MLFNYYFHFQDSDGNLYKLRRQDLTGVSVLYKGHSSVDSFTETRDFNVDEEDDSLWLRLPKSEGEPTDLVITLNSEPLRTLTTGLITLELTPYTVGFTVTATPVPVYSKQGYSPRIIDGYWWQFDDMQQTFVNTGIAAVGSSVEPSTIVVDYPEENNMNPVTSNALYRTEQNMQSNVTNINNRINDVDVRLQSLASKTYSVTLNGELHESDMFGNIDLGTIDTGVAGTRMLEGLEYVDGDLYPRGTMVDAENKVLATSPERYFKAALSGDNSGSKWWLVAILYEGQQFNLQHTIYNTSKYGTCWYSRNGYDGRIVTTSTEIAQLFKYQVRYGNCEIYCKGAVPPALIPHIQLSSSGNFDFQRIQMSVDFDDSKLLDFDDFLIRDSQDWLTITGPTYSVAPTDLTVTNYIISEPLTYTFTDVLEMPVSLTFKATNTATATVTDGEFTTTSETIEAGEIATLIFSGTDSFEWNYSKTLPEIVSAVKVNGETYLPDSGIVDLGEIKGGGEPDEYVKKWTATSTNGMSGTGWRTIAWSATNTYKRSGESGTVSSIYDLGNQVLHTTDKTKAVAAVDELYSRFSQPTAFPVANIKTMKEYVEAKIAEVPEAPVTSVNGETGDVVIDTYTLEVDADGPKSTIHDNGTTKLYVKEDSSWNYSLIQEGVPVEVEIDNTWTKNCYFQINTLTTANFKWNGGMIFVAEPGDVITIYVCTTDDEPLIYALKNGVRAFKNI